MRFDIVNTSIRGLALILLILRVGFTPASAGPLQIFNATGSFGDGATLGGTVTIDTVAGDITALDLTATGLTPIFPPFQPFSEIFTELTSQRPFGGVSWYVFSFADPVGGTGTFTLDTSLNSPAVGSLVGYKGGGFITVLHFSEILTGQTAYVDLDADARLSAAAPEPGAFVLLGLGLLLFVKASLRSLTR